MRAGDDQGRPMQKIARFAILMCFAASSIAAEPHKHQPYAGQQQREVKALSDDEVKQYLSGAGMGYAKAAELNGYPGPMHVLELADKLGLSAEQRSATRLLMEKHKADAQAIGAKRVAAERSLDTMFRSGEVGKERLSEAVRAAAEIE